MGQLLAECIRNLRMAHGADVVINILAHSMGGLVGRHFLESGLYDEAKVPGFANVKRLITLGTPHRGAPLALPAAVGQVKRLFLSAAQVMELASNPAFPALYQLLPSAVEPFVWNSKGAARLAPVSIYDPAIAKQLNLSQSNLDSASAFHKTLNAVNRPPGIDYFCFVGTRHATYSNVRADFSAVAPIVQAIEIEDAGDGTVPSWSASVAGMQQLPVGGEHGTIFNDDGLLQTLGALLGKPGVLVAADPTKARLSLSNEVVEPKASVAAHIVWNRPVTTVSGEFVVTKVADGRGVALPAAQQMTPTFPVAYKGSRIEALTIKFTAPRFAGAYTVDFRVGGAYLAEHRPMLLVQQL